MKNYLLASFDKFRKDVLSKIIYDFIKYLFYAFCSIIISKHIPLFQEVLQTEVVLSVWLLGIIIILSIIVILILYSFMYNSAYKKIKERSQIDELTGVKNHKAMEEILDNIFSGRTLKDNLPVTLILFDIDNFKDFNSLHGYEKADQILQKLGDFLNRDNRITDQVFRYFLRGDEFLVVAYKTNLSNGKIAADRKRNLIAENNFVINNETFKLTVSCGVTTITSEISKIEVMDKLNAALLNAKKYPGKNKTETIF